MNDSEENRKLTIGRANENGRTIMRRLSRIKLKLDEGTSIFGNWKKRLRMDNGE